MIPAAAGTIRGFLLWLFHSVRHLEFRISFILISTVVIQIISYYYASRRFFRSAFGDALRDNPLLNLYEYVYWFLGDFVVQFAFPLLLIVVVLKERPAEFGISTGDRSLGLRVAMLFWGILLPVLWITSSFDGFQLIYPHARIVRTDWSLFLVYELCFILYMIGWEFVWRGYLLFGLRERFGDAAVLVQMLPFVLLHFGKPVLETTGAVIGGLALGFLALRTGSFWYGAMTHILVMLTMDLLATLRFRAQNFSILPSAITEVFRPLF